MIVAVIKNYFPFIYQRTQAEMKIHFFDLSLFNYNNTSFYTVLIIDNGAYFVN